MAGYQDRNVLAFSFIADSGSLPYNRAWVFGCSKDAWRLRLDRSAITFTPSTPGSKIFPSPISSPYPLDASHTPFSGQVFPIPKHALLATASLQTFLEMARVLSWGHLLPHRVMLAGHAMATDLMGTSKLVDFVAEKTSHDRETTSASNRHCCSYSHIHTDRYRSYIWYFSYTFSSFHTKSSQRTSSIAKVYFMSLSSPHAFLLGFQHQGGGACGSQVYAGTGFCELINHPLPAKTWSNAIYAIVTFCRGTWKSTLIKIRLKDI